MASKPVFWVKIVKNCHKVSHNENLGEIFENLDVDVDVSMNLHVDPKLSFLYLQ